MTNKTTCSKCGKHYQLTELYDIDTWNIGHYGCTSDNAPRIHKGWRDDGCPHCHGNGIGKDMHKPIIRDDGLPSGNRSKPSNDAINKLLDRYDLNIGELFDVYEGTVNTLGRIGTFYIDSDYGLYRHVQSKPGMSKSILWNILMGRYGIIKHPTGERNDVLPKITKVEGTSMLSYGIVKLKNNRNYTFMYYSALNLKQGDTVVCDTAQGFDVGVVSEIESCSIPPEQVTKFIIQKVDIAAFNEMKSRYERIKGIQAKMEERRKSLEQMAIYQMMAKDDPEMARLLAEMQSEMQSSITGFQPIDTQEE